MTTVNNSEVIQELRNAAKLQLGKDRIPNFLSSGIVPTIELSSKLVKNGIAKATSQTTTGTTTIYATPATQDFYLCGIEYGFVKNATCDVATGTLNVTATINGSAQTIATIPVLTLTAERGDRFIYLSHPIKIDRGINIQLSGTFTAGAMSRSATVYGFIDETSNG